MRTISQAVAAVTTATPGIVLARSDRSGWDGTMGTAIASVAADLLSDGPVADVTIISTERGATITDTGTLTGFDAPTDTLTLARDNGTLLRIGVDEVQAFIVAS